MASSRSSSSSESEVDSYSKTCVKSYASLKEQYDNLSFDYKKSQFNLVSYKAECQVIDKFKKGLGYNATTATSPVVEGFVNLTNKSGSDKAYHAVPPPLTGNFLPGKPDLTFIDEIVESENLDVTTVVTPSNEKTVENRGVFNTFESNTIRRECCAPINEELVSDGKKKTVVPTIPKVDVVRPKQQEKPVRKTVKQVNTARQKVVANAVRTNRVNGVKASACWVWRPVKPNSASITLKKYNYVDARGRSSQDKAFIQKLEDSEDEHQVKGRIVRIKKPLMKKLDD
ncbi:hypothetical protein Tco_1132677 [Tanacetum coccineum]|uniref:Uncharacterized protein n=1 Tax=Tanacetum coccineum TaxID=301880 RepID=A0ABQ5JDQ9_9ASTR